MEIEPVSGSSEDDYDGPGPRNVVVGFGPVLDNYDGLLVSPTGPHRRLSTALSKKWLDISLRRCPGGPGDPYYEAHLRYLQTLAHTWESGGSVVVMERWLLTHKWQEASFLLRYLIDSIKTGKVMYKTPNFKRSALLFHLLSVLF
jgi:hypothetical protein